MQSAVALHCLYYYYCFLVHLLLVCRWPRRHIVIFRVQVEVENSWVRVWVRGWMGHRKPNANGTKQQKICCTRRSVEREPNKQINKYVTMKVLLVFFFSFFFIFVVHNSTISNWRCAAFVLRLYFPLLQFILFLQYANYKLMRCVKIKQENLCTKEAAKQRSEATNTLHTFLALTLSDCQVTHEKWKKRGEKLFHSIFFSFSFFFFA